MVASNAEKVQERMRAPLGDFDFSILNDPEFKEDAVREDLVAPLLRALGYGATGPDRMVRSRALEHPYVSIGSIKRSISIYPDYLLYVRNELTWVLDAKSPRENIADPEHLSQAYTYAVHRDVRANWYGLCNGHELVVHHVADMGPTPRLQVPLRELTHRWNEVKSVLLPPVIGTHGKAFAKDFGIHLLKLGVAHTTEVIFPDVLVPMIGREGDRFSICVNVMIEGSEYAACYDFGPDGISQLLSLMRPSTRAQLDEALANDRSMVFLSGATCIGIRARLTQQILENEEEHYLPLEVLGFFT